MSLESITIFTDGASRGNPGPGGWAAIIILSQNDNGGTLHATRYTLHEIGGRETHTTNNRMELRAAIEAMLRIKDKGLRISIYADSSYLINGITKWVHGWQKNNWKTKAKQDVENKDLWETLAELTRNYAEHTQNKIKWELIEGHAGVVGNERCDEIATAFAGGKKPELYSGVLKNYRIKNVLDIRGLPSNLERGSTSKKQRSKGLAYSYISMIDGVIQTHQTWAECEKRVKGARGAKYKKVFSAKEEKTLTREWGKM